MECHNCNAPVDKEDAFCRNCGTRHNTKLTDRQCFKCKQFFKSSDLFCGSCGEAVQTKCQKCGSLIEPNKKFCTTCGAKQVSQPSIQSTCIKCGNSVVDNEAQLCSQCSALPEEGLRITENQSSLHPPECAVQNLLNAGNGGAASESDISNTPADCTTDLSSSVTAQNNARTAEKKVSDTRDDSDLELPPNPVIDNKSELTSPMKDGVTIPYDASSPNATSSSQKPTQCTEQESSEDKNASPEVIENDDDSKLPTESTKLNVSAEISKHPILSERKESGTLFEKDLPVGSQDVSSSHSTSTDPPNSFTHSQVQSKDLQQLTNGNELAERKEANEDEDIKTSEEISNEDKDKESDNGGNSSEGSNDDTTEHSEPIGKDTGKQQKKKNKPNSRQRKKFQQRGPQAQEQKRKSQKALIAFHVVISSQFKPLQSGDHVFMRWKAENDTKKSAVVILSSSGAQNETGHYYKAEVDRKTLPQNVKFRYYYGIMRDGKEETEKVYTKKKTDCKDDFCRENQLRSTSNQDTFHVYDGVAYPHSMESLIDKVRQSTRIFTSSKDIFARDLVSAPALFLPSPSDICKDLFQSENANHGKSAEQFMQLIKNIVGDISTEPVQTSMKLHLITPLLHSLSILSPNSGNSFTLSMFVYILAKEWDIKLSFEELNIIYKGLLIKPASNDKKCQELLILHHHFPNDMKEKRNLAHSLLSCINEDVRDTDPSWLYCIPLLHILSDETVPFQEPLPSPEHATPKWWGESKYGKRVKRFKEAAESSPWKIPEEQVFEDLKPALRADPLMLRSFVGTLHLDSLLKFLSMTVVPLNIIMASLYFYVKTEPKKVMQNSQTTVLILRNAVSNAREKVRNFRNPSKREAEIVMADTTIAVELLDKIVNNIRLHDIIFPAVILALVHLDLYTRGHFHLHHEYNFPKLYTANHDNAVIFIGGWMKAIRLHQNEASTVLGMVEECIMQCKDIAHEDVQRDLEKAFILNIREVFEKLGTDDRLAACFSLMDFPILSKATNSFHCLEQNIALIFKNDSWHMYDNPRQFIICKQLSRLLEDRYYSIVRSHEEMMVFVFTWTPLNVYLHLRYEAIFMNNLSRDAAAIVFRTSDFVTDLLTRLYTAAVTVSEVKFLFNNREGLFNVVQTVDTHDNGRADYVLQLRFKEVFTFQSLAIEMNCLHKACRKYCITDDADDVIKQTFENNGDIEMKFLRDLLNTWPSQTETISVHEYQPQIRLYGVPYDVNSFLPSVAYHLNSAVFNYMLERNARSMRLSPNNKWWDVIFQLWRQSSDEFTRVSKQITTGNITLEEVQTLFSSLGEDVKWFDYCKKELKKMASPDNTSWVQERLGQIKCLSDLTVLRDVANIVSSLKQDCEFDGDVNDIETFLKVNMTLQLKDLKPSVVETSCALSVITREEVEYLRQFGSATCAPFIQWVKETMSGDGLQEVKVFVDLALNYVGDKPMEMDKVHNLQAVVTGYAPLIFQTSTRTGTFLDRCYSVCQNIKADPNLPKKLESTVHFLEWFDEIHKFHGSVEKTALAQVESISKRGILKLCKEDILKTKRVHDISLAKVICLEVPEDKESQSSAKTYTYQEMTDLQSRLMLVVGHAEENDKNVERFKSVMDSIERLAKLYVQLCRDGCLLFLDWNVKFFCDQTINVRCITEFFHGKKTNQKFKGLRESHTLEDYIAMVATFLEDCGSQWLTYVAEIRRRFIELNMFTMEQLVFLQEQLVLYENGTLNRHIFQLLSLLRPNCSPDHVQEAMEKASDEVAAKSNVENRENVTVEDNNALIAAQFIKYMCDNGFSRLLASEALSSGIDPTDLDQGIEWCMEHANELGEESQKEDPAEDFQTPSRGGALQILLSRKETIAMALKLLETQGTDAKLSLEAMSTKLNEVWKRFLQTVTYSGEDCLSLEHLGLVLKYLAQQDDRKFERRLPTGLKQGCPNLLLCPKNDVLDVVTSLYMTTQDSPLPQPDEVLLCTPETTFEQVNIFLLRAFSTRSYEKGSLHCMVFADSLDYDNSEKTENQLREYVNTTDHNYQLVVICTKENEFKAHLSAALEKYLCATPVSAKSKILSYLQKKFTICMDIRQDQTAASIDPERVCVRLVKSSRSGMGKTLYKNRLAARLERSVKHKYRYEVDVDSDEDSELKRDNLQTTVTIPLYEKAIDARGVASRLMPYVQSPDYQIPRIIHLDISYEVLEGVDILLYSLLVLGCITDYKGHAWLRSDSDLYLVEAIPLLEHSDDQKSHLLVHQMFNVLPSVTCWSPVDCLSILKKEGNLVFSEWDQVFDDEAFQSDVFQRPVHYLSTIARRQQPKRFTPGKMQTDSNAKQVCLETIINHCGIQSPSWSELYNFVSFLNKQLQDFENSVFCSRPTSHDLPGFSAFVLRFVIHMSRDFATRSLIIAEESIPAFAVRKKAGDDNQDLEKFQMRRKWESSPHPYIFFNPDANSMTFLGFTIQQPSGNLLDQNGRVLERNIMRRDLYHSLLLNNVPLSEEFDRLPREERLLKLYRVMGLTHEEMTDEEEHIIDPDTTYELTTDNVKKILAIYMRFRCNIPVVVMGETGCGKTRLVKFMCALQTPKHPSLNTMILMKVHGGTTAQDIGKKVEEAENLAKKIKQEFKTRTVYTVLFFDEANTTEAIGAIKEVMCDSAFNGKPIRLHANLKMVAACNPYKKHTPEVIQRLEKAGLGYHVNADKTRDKLGRLPMRQLVYRVQPLPQSMLPLVWDFGQLTSEAESIYIVHMVLRFIRSGQLGALSKTQISSICRILVVSQTVMREKNDECSFVSLRDADRALTVCSWFLKQHEIMNQLDHMLRLWRVDHITKSLVLALGVCYRAGLRSKLGFDRAIVPYFGSDFPLDGGENLFRSILDSCAELMLENIRPVKKIARNQALKENVFMMVVCVELRIPLFLVGKPGSSKSLAKTLVADAMRGAQSHGELFRSLKEAQVVSFQCSPLSTADGILATFRQCAHIQKGKDKDKFVSVVVLDEVGLAEDSPKMPLKVLHPLLEEGCEVQGIPHQSKEDGVDFDESVTESEQDDVPEDTVSKTYEKVAFIGISNWALDPAKMNRGLLVQRDVPDEEELVQTAESICDDENGVLGFVKELLKKLAKAYLKIFNEAINKKEFFGLRDFYSMVKMVHAYAKKNKRKLTRAEFHMAILRNFGGLDSLDPVDIFEQVFSLKDLSRDVDCQIVTPLQMALRGENIGDECRYLLLLTESNVGLRILEDILNKDHVVPIYGSSFPKDQGYTQICSNINRIKVCMETGKTVILLNLDNLYESLYDALNQSYSILAGVQYVDLGLGSHRVKCKVDKKFRLIVVAEKHTVYEKFPIPLINRLEKHFLTVSNVLDNVQQNMETKLNAWVASVIRLSKAKNVGDVFIGFHQDTLASVILMCSDKDTLDNNEEDVIEKIMERCRSTLLWFATPDAIIRSQDSELSRVYFQEQQHDNLAQYLKARLECSFSTSIMAQVTTHSRILTENERKELEVDLPDFKFTLISLQAFQTEQQFMHQLREFLGTSDDDQKKVLIVQCESGNRNQTLLQCAQYCIQSVWPFESVTRHVVFTVQLPRIASNAFMGFQGGKWHCAHIDELRSSSIPLPDIIELQTKSPAQLMSSSIPHKIDGSQRLHVEQEDEEDTNTGLHKDLIHNLVINSVHVAMACVKDREADSDRSMRRITILLQCLEHTNDDTFFRGLWSLMISIIREIESTTPEKRNWLAEDAARLECVKKTGTFRRAWIQSLQNYLVPVLAGVVAFLDTNNNLNFMDSQSDKPHCLNQMWLNMFNNQSLCNLKYNDLLSLSTRQNELQELICRSTFLAGSLPSAELPFSWMISELVDTMLIVPSSELQDDGMDTSESELKYHLQDLINSDVESSDFLHRYASDLVRAHFKLNPTNHQLIIQCLMAAMRQFGLSLEPYDIGRSLLQMHRVLFQVRPRLLAVLDMTACHPMAVQQLQEKLSDPQNLFYGADEMTEDVLLLSMLLEELSPQKDQLNTDKGCQTWLDLFNLVAPVISRVITEIDANLEQKIDLSDGKDANITNCFPYGERCQQQLDSIRCQWMRIAAVKLFIDYMSPLVRDSRKTQLDSKRVNYMLLANLLAKKANLKTKEALLNVDKFLKHANSQMVRGLLGEVGSCMHCTTKLEGPPVLLPCSHRICNKCYTQEAKVGQKCPECLNSIPETFDPDNSDLPNREAVNQLLHYQRQSSSFLMALVSQFCFSGREPPEPDAVEHIFGYIIRREKSTSTIRTQQLTLHDDQIDPSPVLRSFILRLLLQYSEKEVSQHITRFLEDAKSMIQQQVGAERNTASVLTELSLLIIHCIENLQHEKEAIDEKRNDDKAHGLKCKNQCSYIADLLHEVRRVLDSPPLELSTLISMGRLRYALDSCARVLYACVIQPTTEGTLNKDVKDLMMVASYVCEMGSTDWPKKFLIKQLCREFGVETLTILIQRAQQEKCLKWLQLDNIEKIEEVPDRYLLCGENYVSLRTEIMQVIKGIDGELEQNLTLMPCTKRKKEYFILLTLHREVTMACVNENSVAFRAVLQTKAQELVQSANLGIDEDLARRICTNSLGIPGSPLCVDAGQSLAEQSLVCVLTHFWMALRAVEQPNDIALSFITIINQPDSMLTSYLPTMPDDHVEEIAQALAIDPNSAYHHIKNPETPKMYACPNGHRYIIGNCGNPNSQSRCPECGILIGGKAYVPAEGNLQVSTEDRTKPGHTLGPAENRSREAIPERHMSATVCAVLRFLTHASLFLSASQPQQANIVIQMVKPPLPEDKSVVTFFWEHLQLDVQVLARAFHRCCDDVYLLLHALCHYLSERKPVKRRPLTSKSARTKWEKQFCDLIILPILKQAEVIIQQGNQLIVNDTRQGQNQLLNLIFEVGEEDVPDPDKELQHTAVPWKYRTRITVDHFFDNFQLHMEERKGGAKEYPVLKLFQAESLYLRALYYVPDILEHQHRLMQSLRQRLSREEAAKKTVSQALENKECGGLHKLLRAFSTAWDMVKTHLISYRCMTDEGLIQLPAEFHNVTINVSSPLAILLPATRGPGLCSYILIHFLLVQHNSFMEAYCPLVKQRYEQLPEITVQDITKRHLLGYSPQSDLLPLVLGHCNYSLHLGHTGSSAAQLDYDFQGFELQLRNTLLLGKSRIAKKENGSLQIETMVYIADTTTSRLFSRLRDKIPQISLSSRVRREIAQDLRGNIPDICQSMDNINTALMYILSLRTDAEKNLCEFMRDTLKMRDTIHSRKAQNHSCLKHVQSLWLLLCMERSAVLASHNQEAFDGQGGDLRKDFQNDQNTALETALKRLKPERLELLLWQLFECIMLRLVQHVGEDFASPDNYSIHLLVCDNLSESPLYAEPPEETKEELLTEDDLKHFPQSLTASQAIPTWLAIHRHIAARVQQVV